MQEVSYELNLVFDYWDEFHKPIPNGKLFFKNKTFGFGLDFLDENQYKVSVSGFSDVYKNSNKKYFYIINNFDVKLYELLYFENLFSNNLIDCLKNCENIFLIFISVHEPECERGIVSLINYLKLNQIDENRIYVINNNSKLNEIKEKNNTKINFYTLNILPWFTKCAFELYGGNDFLGLKNGKFFMSFNRSPKAHRISLLCLLKTKNILNDVNWSYIPEGTKNFDFIKINQILDETEIENYKNEIDYFDNLINKKSDYEINYDFLNDDGQIKLIDGGPSTGYGIPELKMNYLNSYVNIVTESVFCDNNDIVHISEKSFRPFFYHQIPIFLSSQHHLKFLKMKYDLDLFDDLINNSYDDEPNHSKRFHMVIKEIELLHKNKDKVIEYYILNQERFEQNKIKIMDKISIKEDYNYFTNLITNG